ncbi:hypothetical protein Plhal304r1_c017g0061041 [Plasmopara halstedii]
MQVVLQDCDNQIKEIDALIGTSVVSNFNSNESPGWVISTFALVIDVYALETGSEAVVSPTSSNAACSVRLTG